MNVTVGDAIVRDSPLDAPPPGTQVLPMRPSPPGADFQSDAVIERGLRKTRDVTLEPCPLAALRPPSQGFLVLNSIAPPRGEGPTRAMLRFSAAFETEEKAAEHARRLSTACDGAYDVFVVEMGRWTVFPVPDTSDFAEIKRYVNGEVERVMRAHFENSKEVRAHNMERVRRAREDGRAGRAGEPEEGAPETVVEYDGAGAGAGAE